MVASPPKKPKQYASSTDDSDIEVDICDESQVACLQVASQCNLPLSRSGHVPQAAASSLLQEEQQQPDDDFDEQTSGAIYIVHCAD